MSAYSQASDAGFEVFHDTTPVVEPLSVDEAFLDVSGLWRVAGTPLEVAAPVRGPGRGRLGLALPLGLARTQLLGNVPSQEAQPRRPRLVPPGRETALA